MGRGQSVNFLNIEIKQQVKEITYAVSGVYILNAFCNAVTGMKFVTEINHTVITGLKFFGMIKGNQHFTGVDALQVGERSYGVIAGGRGNDNQVFGL